MDQKTQDRLIEHLLNEVNLGKQAMQTVRDFERNAEYTRNLLNNYEKRAEEAEKALEEFQKEYKELDQSNIALQEMIKHSGSTGDQWHTKALELEKQVKELEERLEAMTFERNQYRARYEDDCPF